MAVFSSESIMAHEDMQNLVDRTLEQFCAEVANPDPRSLNLQGKKNLASRISDLRSKFKESFKTDPQNIQDNLNTLASRIHWLLDASSVHPSTPKILGKNALYLAASENRTPLSIFWRQLGFQELCPDTRYMVAASPEHIRLLQESFLKANQVVSMTPRTSKTEVQVSDNSLIISINCLDHSAAAYLSEERNNFPQSARSGLSDIYIAARLLKITPHFEEDKDGLCMRLTIPLQQVPLQEKKD